MMNKLIEKSLLIQASIILSIYILLFAFSPLQGEDYGLTRHFSNETLYERIIYSFEKSAYQINNWNARLGEQLSIFSLSMPSIFFNLISFISLISLCYVLSQLFANKNNKFIALLVSIVSIFAFWPGMELFTWRTVITGYTIPMIITLIVVSKFMNYERREALNNNKIQLSFYCFLGFLSGLSFENVPIATVFFMVSVLLFSRELLTKCLLVPAFTMIGWLLLIIAPSTSIRRHQYDSWYNNGLSLHDYINLRFIDVVTFFYDTSIYLFLVSIISIIFLALMHKLKREALLLIASSVLVVGSMMASPYTEPRSFMFAWCIMSSVIIDSLYSAITNKYKASFVILIFFAISVSSLSEALKQNFSFYQKTSARQEMIENRLGTQYCIDGIEIHPITGFYNYRYLNNRDEWFYQNTKQISTYYGCRIVK